MARVLLLLPSSTYKAEDFLAAAEAARLGVVVGTDGSQALEGLTPDGTIVLSFTDAARAESKLRGRFGDAAFAAIVGADDETTVLAAELCARFGLPHDPPEAVAATRDKERLRERLASAGCAGPVWRAFDLADAPAAVPQAIGYPCVVKPVGLSAGRGVLRADDDAAFRDAVERIAAIVADPEVRRRCGARAERLIVERFLPGEELALEGLLEDGRLTVLALFDKPDPLDGPTFEETLYVTPSRQPAELQQGIAQAVAAACTALGLTRGPVHAEVRLVDGAPVVLEVAARTIGGLCARTLRFGAGRSLEEVVLRQAAGLPPIDGGRQPGAAGVLMLPIPRAGVLREVRGADAARAVPLVEELTFTLHPGAELVPLPEGHRYLGFLFARGERAAGVEAALRDAHARLEFEIEG